jgi:hypothetical protein
MSLLDHDEIVANESKYAKNIIATVPSMPESFPAGSSVLIDKDINTTQSDTWLKIEADIEAPNAQWQSYLNAELQAGDSIKKARVRLFRPLVRPIGFNHYEFHLSVPEYFRNSHLKIFLTSAGDFKGRVEGLRVTLLHKED